MTTFPIPPSRANHILVASPSSVVRERVLKSLRSPVRCFEQATGGAEALVHLESGLWQALFLDRHLPDLDAEELSHTVHQRFPGIEVVLLDPDRDAASAWDDAQDTPPEMWPALSQDNEKDQDKDQNKDPDNKDQDKKDQDKKDQDRKDQDKNRSENYGLVAHQFPASAASILVAPLPGMVGNSDAMQPVYRLARLLAPRNTSVLITGPTGCGKEVVARALHQLSPRAGRGFAVVNCAAIPETMLEAELFGYARGAFTGAAQSYAGRIQAAQGGTLFLDEIGEMPLSLQPKLLRFLEQKELQRLGSAEVVRVDARLISATNAHLLSLVREGKFREDLYYRLCGFPIEIPPLRARPEDIGALAAHFIEKYAERPPAPELSAPALHLLQAQPWAGNIRELQNVIERALILSEGQAYSGPTYPAPTHTAQIMIRPEHLLFADASLRGY